MALVIGKNSYMTLDEAKSLAQVELDSGSPEAKLWSELSDSDKEIVCKKGTIEINTLNFKGRSIKNKYDLKFPRLINGVETIPESIKIAALIQGLMSRLVTSGEYYNLAINGVESMTVGPNNVRLNTDRFNGIRIHEKAMVYVEPYIKKSGG